MCVRSAWSIAIGAALLPAACVGAPPASPAKTNHCVQLYTLWSRYGQHVTFHHTGQRARAELAVEDCRDGRYEQGLAELEELLRRNRIPIPPS